MKRPCVFLDRDGVINVAPPEGEYVVRWEDFELIPETVDWIRLFKTLGYLVIVVTNQRAVARGLLTAGELEAIHRKMRQALAERGAAIDAVYCCPHEEGSCACRKPAPGLVLEAVRDFDIDLRSSILIGDSRRDRELAEGLGIAYVEVRNGRIVEVVPRR